MFKGKKLNFTRLAALVGCNFGILLAGIILLELFFGNWFHPTRLNRLNLAKDVVMEIDVSRLYRSPNTIIRYTRDRFGLRGSFDGPESIDIITIGGSTTDQLYVSDGKTWQDVMTHEFKLAGKIVNIANAGVNGQSTYGHIKNFDWWFPYIPDLQPKYILFYIGINDFYRDIHLNFFNKQEDFVSDALKDTTLFDYLEENSALFYLWRIIKGSYQARVVHKIHHRYVDFSRIVYTERPLSSNYEDLMAPFLAAYEERLRILCEKTKAFNAIPIFVTQTSRDYKIVNGNVMGVNYHYKRGDFLYNGVDYYYMLRLINQKTIEVCQRIEGCIPLDLASHVTLEKGDTYDFCHVTPAGAEKVGRYLFHSLQELF